MRSFGRIALASVPAVIFVIVVVPTFEFAIGLERAFNGWGRYSPRGAELQLSILLITGSLAVLIVLATNWIGDCLVQNRRSRGWSIAAGIALATILGWALLGLVAF